MVFRDALDVAGSGIRRVDELDIGAEEPGVVERFRKAGFSFVTVGELLRRVPLNVIDHPLASAV